MSFRVWTKPCDFEIEFRKDGESRINDIIANANMADKVAAKFRKVSMSSVGGLSKNLHVRLRKAPSSATDTKKIFLEEKEKILSTLKFTSEVLSNRSPARGQGMKKSTGWETTTIKVGSKKDDQAVKAYIDLDKKISNLRVKVYSALEKIDRMHVYNGQQDLKKRIKEGSNGICGEISRIKGQGINFILKRLQEGKATSPEELREFLERQFEMIINSLNKLEASIAVSNLEGVENAEERFINHFGKRIDAIINGIEKSIIKQSITMAKDEGGIDPAPEIKRIYGLAMGAKEVIKDIAQNIVTNYTALKPPGGKVSRAEFNRWLKQADVHGDYVLTKLQLVADIDRDVERSEFEMNLRQEIQKYDSAIMFF